MSFVDLIILKCNLRLVREEFGNACIAEYKNETYSKKTIETLKEKLKNAENKFIFACEKYFEKEKLDYITAFSLYNHEMKKIAKEASADFNKKLQKLYTSFKI